MVNNAAKSAGYNHRGYHGTNTGGFRVFDKAKLGTRVSIFQRQNKLGFYFSSDIHYATTMSLGADNTNAKVYDAYLKIHNPIRVLLTEILDPQELDDIEAKKATGKYDGIIDDIGQMVVFEPNQIKSADPITFPNLWNVAAEESDTRNPTQVTSTVSTYRRIFDILKSEGFKGKILDASSGMGIGTKTGREEYGFDVEDIEPYPGNGYIPMYTDYSALGNKYDVIISSAVLNVLPQDQRDALVVKMGKMLNVGGRMFVTTRGKDVENLAKTGKNIHLGDIEWIETVKGSYQKGFTNPELILYMRDALGDNFSVVPASKETGGKFNNNTNVVVTKLAEDEYYGFEDSDTQYQAAKANRGRPIEIETMENNRFERLRNFGDNPPKQWYAFTGSNFYIYENQSFMDYTLLLKATLLKTNKADIYKFVEEVENGTFGSAETYDSWIENFRRGKGRNSWYRISATKTGTAGQSYGIYGNEQRSDYIGYIRNNSEIGEELIEYQTRTTNLSNRELLSMAADNISESELTDGEKDALRIFKERLNNLYEIEQKRREEGRLYKEHQFGEHVDREAAEKTRERMKILDEQISRQNGEVLKVENSEVAKKVLTKFRSAAEGIEHEKMLQSHKRYVERRDNSEKLSMYRSTIKDDIADLTKWMLHPNNKSAYQHVPYVIRDSVAQFIESIDRSSKKKLSGKGYTKADMSLIDTMQKLHNSIKSADEIAGEYSGYIDLPDGFLDELQNYINALKTVASTVSSEGYILNQMTSDELKTLARIVKLVKKLIVNMNSFHQNAMFQHTQDAGENSIDHMAQYGNASNAGDISNFFLWQQIRPAYAFERFGKGGVSIYDEFRRAQATMAFNTIKIKQFAEKTYTAEEVKEWEDKILTFNLGGDTVHMPVSYLMGLYELAKDPDALNHILSTEGGLRIATHEEGKKKVSDNGHRITVEELSGMLNKLTDRQKDVADALQKYMANQGAEWGNYVTMARWGEKQLTNPRYYPINSDGRRLTATADESPKNASLYALLNSGFLKERKPKAGNRIIVYSIFDVFSNHMASMSQYNAFALPVLDSLKWFNYKRETFDELTEEPEDWESNYTEYYELVDDA